MKKKLLRSIFIIGFFWGTQSMGVGTEDVTAPTEKQEVKSPDLHSLTVEESRDNFGRPKFADVTREALDYAKKNNFPVEFWTDIDGTLIVPEEYALENNYEDVKNLPKNFKGYELLNYMRRDYEDVLKELDKNGVKLKLLTTRGTTVGLIDVCAQLRGLFSTNPYANSSPSMMPIKNFCQKTMDSLDKTGHPGNFISVETNPEDTIVLSALPKYKTDPGNIIGPDGKKADEKGLILSKIVEKAKQSGQDKGVLFFVDNSDWKVRGLDTHATQRPEKFEGWRVYSVFFPNNPDLEDLPLSFWQKPRVWDKK